MNDKSSASADGRVTANDTIRDLSGQPITVARPRLGKRISWAEFYREFPHLRPDNQNGREKDAA
jgi:hypothetical protein